MLSFDVLNSLQRNAEIIQNFLDKMYQKKMLFIQGLRPITRIKKISIMPIIRTAKYITLMK